VHQRRIADLTRLKSEGGGFGLSDDAATVIAERAKPARAVSERDRQQALYEIRSARWNTCMQLRGAVSDWLLRGGVPGGCGLEPIEDAPVSELLRKGERIGDGVERYRHRLRELAADLHRVNSSPWPSSMLKAEAKALVEQWAEAAKPDFDSMVEHQSPLSFQTQSLSSLVRGEKPALAFTETVDACGLLCWLFPQELQAKINAGLDEVSDDKSALDQQQREQMEAQISSDMLAIERAEVALIWAAEAQNNEILDFRSTTSPQSLLGFRLVSAPRTNPSGTSPQHVIDIAGVQ